MKTSTSLFLITVCSLMINCSSDDELLAVPTAETPTGGEKPQTEDPLIIPFEPTAPTTAQEIPGYPKSIRKYHNGGLIYWAYYYFRSDGKLLQITYGYEDPPNEIFTNIYHYDSEGKLIKLEGHDVYDYHWENDRIVMVEAYNAMWFGHSRTTFQYDDKGQIIEVETLYLDFEAGYQVAYSYYDSGNLETIKHYGKNDKDEYQISSRTSFAEYIDGENLFLDIEIIPGVLFSQQLPTLIDYQYYPFSEYNFIENYKYRFNNGKLTERTSQNTKVVYEYY
ncbi:hypothetical protein E0K83_10090 [Gramella sp. BOM4]|nr:hypothetical protein [Christiangramia bathymodioli]